MPAARSFLVVLLTAISLLCSQTALASYFCPAMDDGSGMTASMPGCTGMDMDQPALCHTHLQAGDQSADKPQQPDVPAFIPAALIVITPPVALFLAPSATQAAARHLQHGTSPPIAIRHCCLRI
jgi:hypothetical protein